MQVPMSTRYEQWRWRCTHLPLVPNMSSQTLQSANPRTNGSSMAKRSAGQTHLQALQRQRLRVSLLTAKSTSWNVCRRPTQRLPLYFLRTEIYLRPRARNFPHSSLLFNQMDDRKRKATRRILKTGGPTPKVYFTTVPQEKRIEPPIRRKRRFMNIMLSLTMLGITRC